MISIEKSSVLQCHWIDVISFSFEPEVLGKESERFSVPASQVDDFRSLSEFESLFHEIEMIVERWYIWRSFVSRENRS